MTVTRALTPIRHRLSAPAFQRGFTLIEVMMALAIIALLTAIAIPSYTSYVARGTRTAAQTVMMDIGSKQEQFLLVNRRYGDADDLLGQNYVLPDGLSLKYDMEVYQDMRPEPYYLITFTPKDGFASDYTLTLNNLGEKTPTAAW